MTLDTAAILNWLATTGLRIALVVLGALLLLRLLNVATFRLRDLLERQPAASALTAPMRQARARTLASILARIVRVIVVVIAGLMILLELRFDVAPLLAGASLLGLALSLASQSFVKNLIGGMFILAEGRYDLGDRVQIGSFEGIVEQISLYSTFLRADDGTLVIIPNGTIDAVSNRSRDWRRLMFECVVSRAQADEALRIVRNTAQALPEEPAFRDRFLTAPALAELGPMDPEHLRLRVQARVLPGTEPLLALELHRRLVRALAQAGIEFQMPVPLPA